MKVVASLQVLQRRFNRKKKRCGKLLRTLRKRLKTKDEKSQSWIWQQNQYHSKTHLLKKLKSNKGGKTVTNFSLTRNQTSKGSILFHKKMKDVSNSEQQKRTSNCRVIEPMDNCKTNELPNRKMRKIGVITTILLYQS
jgi:hypothetical protein